jgi:hypothetical protein
MLNAQTGQHSIAFKATEEYAHKTDNLPLQIKWFITGLHILNSYQLPYFKNFKFKASQLAFVRFLYRLAQWSTVYPTIKVCALKISTVVFSTVLYNPVLSQILFPFPSK